MQETKQQHQDSEEVYRMTGAVVLALADCGLETTRLRIAGYFREELAIQENGRRASCGPCRM